MTPKHMLCGSALAAALAAGPACAQNVAPTQGSVTIFDPAQIAQESELSVGPVVRPQAGARAAPVVAGAYSVTGLGGDSFSLSVPSTLTLVRQGGAEEIQLRLAPTQTHGAQMGEAGKISATRVGIGGSLPVSSTAVGGAYRGLYEVTLSFQ